MFEFPRYWIQRKANASGKNGRNSWLSSHIEKTTRMSQSQSMLYTYEWRVALLKLVCYGPHEFGLRILGQRITMRCRTQPAIRASDRQMTNCHG